MKDGILGFVGENANNILQAFCGSHNNKFALRGYQTGFIDLNMPDCFEAMKSFASRHELLFCYGYAGIGAHITADGVSFWDKYQIPFLSLMYDNPFYYPAHHVVATKWVRNCYGLEDFLDIQRNYFKSPHPSSLLRVASAGYADPTDPDWRVVPWNQREIHGIFIKSGDSLAALELSFDVMPQHYLSIVRDCISVAQKDADLSLANFVHDGFSRANLYPKNDQKIWDDFVYIVRVLDQYLRTWRSNQLVEHIKHLPVLIIGNGWDHIDKTHAKAQFLPSMPIADIKKLLYQSKFVFNAHPYARYGWHERLFFGLELGSAVITDRTRFTDEHFSDLPNFFSFDWGNPSWPERMKYFMNSIEQEGFDLLPAAERLASRFPPDAVSSQMIDIALQMRQVSP